MAIRRGDVYDAALEPTVGSEQAGNRPIVIVSRDGINAAGRVVIGVPFTTHRPPRPLLPSHVLVRPPEGGRTANSVALCEQVRVLSPERLGRFRGTLSVAEMSRVDDGLRTALDLDG